MAAVKTKVALQLGSFFRVTTNVLTAVEDDDKEVSLKTVCVGHTLAKDPSLKAHAPTAIQSVYRCPTCENEDKTSLKKASVAGSVFTVVDAEAIAATAVSEDLKLKIDLQVHKADEMLGSTLPGGKVYFLEPGKGEDSTYALFWQMVTDSPELAFVAVWAARSKPALYRLGTFGKALTITQIAWPTSIKAAPSFSAAPAETDLAMAKMIATAAISPYDAGAYQNGRNAKLMEVIAAAEGVEGLVPVTAAAPASPVVSGLSAMLQAQLDAMKAPAPVAVPAQAAPVKAKAAPRKKAAPKAA